MSAQIPILDFRMEKCPKAPSDPTPNLWHSFTHTTSPCGSAPTHLHPDQGTQVGYGPDPKLPLRYASMITKCRPVGTLGFCLFILWKTRNPTWHGRFTCKKIRAASYIKQDDVADSIRITIWSWHDWMISLMKLYSYYQTLPVHMNGSNWLVPISATSGRPSWVELWPHWDLKFY